MKKDENKNGPVKDENKEPIQDGNKTETSKEGGKGESKKPVCGIVMPISAIDNCSAEHWTEVKRIISEAVDEAGYEPNLVSNADDSGIIQRRIIQNLYDNDIVVCDVSGKNPNVMFELGMRLAFDKPAIIVIDDKTDYSFDTSPIEHLSYPRDLRYYNILIFKDQLKSKIIATVKKAETDSNYTTFLKNFGQFEVAHVEKKEGSINDVLLARLDELSEFVYRMDKRLDTTPLNGERIRAIIISGILEFCSKRNLTINEVKMAKPDAEIMSHLFSALASNRELRRLCETPDVLQENIERTLSLF